MGGRALTLSALRADCPSPLEGEGGWSLALAAFRRAEIAKERFDAASSAASAGPTGRSLEAQEALDERLGGFCNAADRAMLRLLETPAPDLEALVVKIALIGELLAWEMDGGEDCLAWIEADARRLAVRRG